MFIWTINNCKAMKKNNLPQNALELRASLQDSALELCKAQLSFYQHFLDGDMKSLKAMLKDLDVRLSNLEKCIMK